jgi:mannose-6-phosphate isomerase-like protein (cupin superfamily)
MEQIWFIAGLSELLVATDTLSIVRMWTPPGDQPPLHVHHDEDECFHVRSGSVTLWVGDRAPVVIGPGEFARAPKGVPHTYRVGAEPGAFVVTTDGRFAQFVRAAGVPAVRAELPVVDGPPEGLGETAAAYGITLLGPPGMLPKQLRADRERPRQAPGRVVGVWSFRERVA